MRAFATANGGAKSPGSRLSAPLRYAAAGMTVVGEWVISTTERSSPGMRTPWGQAAIIVAILAMSATSPAQAAHPNALWRVVHDLCVPDKKVSGLAAPCMAVDLAHGHAIVTDPGHRTQVLFVPTTRISGIESARLLAAASPNYWQAAWQARWAFERRLGRNLPREDIALAVNSRSGRTQEQLHIHIDCVRADVRRALQNHEGEIGAAWADLPVDLAGHRYRVRRLKSADLGARDPFKLLADDPKAAADMGRQTLVMVGATFEDGSPGFVLLSDRADLARGDKAAGEDLLDHACGVATRP